MRTFLCVSARPANTRGAPAFLPHHSVSFIPSAFHCLTSITPFHFFYPLPQLEYIPSRSWGLGLHACLGTGVSSSPSHEVGVSLSPSMKEFSSVQFSHSLMSDSLRPHGLRHDGQASLSITNSRGSPKLMSIESVMSSNHLILCRPLLLLPSIFPSIRVFSNESALHIRWLKYWSFSFNISPSNEHSGLITSRMDWLDLHAV